ncbi:hypothetical protein JZ751_005792, partial [Albula glossodonta]
SSFSSGCCRLPGHIPAQQGAPGTHHGQEFSQQHLVSLFLNKTYEAHNALEDVRACRTVPGVGARRRHGAQAQVHPATVVLAQVRPAVSRALSTGHTCAHCHQGSKHRVQNSSSECRRHARLRFTRDYPMVTSQRLRTKLDGREN